MKNRKFLFLVLMVFTFSVVSTIPINAKFRDAINFEDNQFVGISQVEALHSYQVMDGSDSDIFDGTQLQYQFTSGVMTNFEIGARVPVRFFDTGTEGIGDISIFQRFKFSQGTDELPNSSGGLELFLPTGQMNSNPPTGTDDINIRLFGTVGHSIDRNWRWLFQSAVKLMGKENIDERWEYNGALRYQTTESLKLVTEINGNTGGIKDVSEIFVSPGLIFRSEDGFLINLSSPVGVTSESTDLKPMVQFAYEF